MSLCYQDTYASGIYIGHLFKHFKEYLGHFLFAIQ